MFYPESAMLHLEPLRKNRRAGFTLVEILIVVIILGIMATIVIPQFSNASLQAKENTMKDDLRYLRIQIEVFKAQHRDTPPGYPAGVVTATASEQDFLDQMMHYTDDSCGTSTTATATKKFGPYLSKMPPNPVNSSTDIMIVGPGPLPTPDATTGWIYQPSTQQIIANLTGNDNTGMAYSKY
ncbi:MAG TPA: prepilin-type N-terminal cleavage/methylation domain-containing protein [Tepidisphaeraceae bacterium]|jgi:general secretion pathway protein G|nr:prepilin-type N-terminal cleavage/methylation domain-containing protein [Tepidisphaeraceae bacterium]